MEHQQTKRKKKNSSAAEMENATLTLDTLARCDSKAPIKPYQSPYKGSHFQQNNRCTDGWNHSSACGRTTNASLPADQCDSRIQYTRVKPICISTVPHAFIEYTTAPHQDKTRNITWCFDTRRYRYGLTLSRGGVITLSRPSRQTFTVRIGTGYSSSRVNV